MAVYEHDSVITYKDENGNVHANYPITKIKNVEGLEAELSGIKTARNETQTDLNNTKTSLSQTQTELDSTKSSLSQTKTELSETKTDLENTQVDLAQAKSDLSKDISELNAKKITKFYASNLGNTTVNDSDSGKFTDMKLYGKSEQKQYSGKNLLPMFPSGTYGSNYVYDVKEDGSIVINGSNGTYAQPGVNCLSVLKKYEGESIIFSGIPEKINGSYQTSIRWVIRCIGDTNIDETIYAGDQITDRITIPTNLTEAVVYVVVADGINVSDFIVQPMIRLATVEDSTYEPYVGGIPSPNPDYPQEIKSVVNPVVKVRDKMKNLLKPTLGTTTKNGITCTNNGDGTYTLNGTATAPTTFMILSGNNSPMLSKSTTLRVVGFKNVFMTDRGSTYVGCRPVGNSWSNSLNMHEDGGNIWGNGMGDIHLVIKDTVSYNNVVIKPMVTTDLNATYDDYEPYTEQTAALPYTLNAIPVESGGNVTIDGQQYIADYVDFEKKQLVRMVEKKYVGTGTDNVFYIPTAANGEYAQIRVEQNMSGLEECCSTCFRKKIFDFTWGNYTLADTRIIIGVNNSPYSTIEEVNDFISSINACFIYKLLDPKIINLTDEEVQAFRDLATYYPTTNVFVSSDQLDGYTTFNYPLNMANGWNYVMQQIEETRPIIYNTQVDVLENRIDTAILAAKMEV